MTTGSILRRPLRPRRGLRLLMGALLALLVTLTMSVVSSPTASGSYAGKDGKIVFARSNQIYTINPNGSGLVKLTSTAKNNRPKWSPDGTRIAFLRTTTSGTDLWVMSANGSNMQQVTHLGNVMGPSWSPDGKWLAFGSPLQRVRSTAPFGTPEVLSARASECCSDEPWQVNGQVAWSADGDHIAFASDSYPDSPDHYLLEYSISRHVVDVLGEVGGECCGYGWYADPFYGPTGGRLGVTFFSDPYDPYLNGDPVPPPQFSYRPPGGTAFPSQPYDQTGAPSPSGQRIAFMNNSTGTPYVYLQNLDGTGRTRLTQGYQPDWQPTSTVPWVQPPPPSPDTLRPILTLNSLRFRVGESVSTSNLFDTDTSNDYTDIPAQLTWSGVDPESGICSYDLARNVSGQPTQQLLTQSTSTKYSVTVSNRSPASPWYDVTARDCAGNETEGYWFPRPIVVDDSGLGPNANQGIQPVFQGTWGISNYSSWSGGTTHRTSTAGASVTINVYGGSSVGVVMALGPDRGSAAIKLDGVTVQTVNTYSAIKGYRVVVASVDVPSTGGAHTLSVVNQATSGHPRIDLDAFLL